MPTTPILRAAAAFVHGLFRSRLSMQLQIPTRPPRKGRTELRNEAELAAEL